MTKIKGRNKIIWGVPFLLSLIAFCLFLKVNLIMALIMALGILIIGLISCLMVVRKRKLTIGKVINLKDLNKNKSGIVIGQKNKEVLLTDEQNVLFIDKMANNEFLNVNLDALSSFSNQPNIMIFDMSNELLDENYDLLKRKGYNIKNFDINNLFIDVLGIINKKITIIKNLELKVANYKGQYLLSNQTYLSYDDIRQNIEIQKLDIIKIIEKFIISYYHLDKLKNEFVVLKYVILSLIDNYLKKKNILELDNEILLKYITDLTSTTVVKLRRVFNSMENFDIHVKTEFNNLKLKNTDLEKILKSINSKTMNLKDDLNNQKEICLEGFYNNKQAYFINGKNTELTKLCLFLLQYVYLDTDMYLLLNTDVSIEDPLESLKVIQVLTELKDSIGIDNYLVKVYRGEASSINKKELLRICKREIDEMNVNDYEKMYHVLRMLEKIDIKKNEVLVIDHQNGHRVITFDTQKNAKNYELNYSRKN